MSQSQFVAASPPGAGRQYEAWMDIPLACQFPVDRVFGSNGVYYQETRIGGTNNAIYGQAAQAFTTQNANNTKTGLYKGRMCIRLPNTNGAAGQIYCNLVALLNGFQKWPNNITSDGPLVWRYVAVIANDGCGPSATPGDNGFIFQPGRVQGFGVEGGAGGGASGFGFFWDAAGHPSWVSHRNIGVLAPDEVVTWGAPVDQEWHAVELQLSAPTQGADGKVALLYDNISVVQRSWGPGTKLPDFTSDPNLMGLQCSVLNGALGFPNNIYLSEFRVIAGPTLQACF